MAVRVLDSDGIGTSVSVARGIRFAVDNGADVINLSLGMYVRADVIRDAIEQARDAGVVVVTAGGNRGLDDRDHFPSRLSETIAVAATDANDLKADFSNYGPHINVAAPGVGLLSTYRWSQAGRRSGWRCIPATPKISPTRWRRAPRSSITRVSHTTASSATEDSLSKSWSSPDRPASGERMINAHRTRPTPPRPAAAERSRSPRAAPPCAPVRSPPPDRQSPPAPAPG